MLHTAASLGRRTFLLAALLVACSDQGPGGGQCSTAGQGAFTANVTGAVSGGAAGCATYMIITLDGAPGTYVNLFGSNTIVGLSRDGLPPAPGTYQVDATTSTTAFHGAITSANVQYVLTSGTVTVSSYNGTVFSGSFSFTGTRSSGETVTAAGTFTALCLEGNVSSGC